MTFIQNTPSKATIVRRSFDKALRSNSSDDWWAMQAALKGNLDVGQVTTLAFLSLRSLEADVALLAMRSVMSLWAGTPIPALWGPMDEAKFWTGMAEPVELEAYALASFQRMASNRQADFLKYAQENLGKQRTNVS